MLSYDLGILDNKRPSGLLGSLRSTMQQKALIMYLQIFLRENTKTSVFYFSVVEEPPRSQPQLVRMQRSSVAERVLLKLTSRRQLGPKARGTSAVCGFGATLGLTVETSPMLSSSPLTILRRIRRMIFPLLVLGRSSTT